MGLGDVLSSEKSEVEGEKVTTVKLDGGGGSNSTADNFQPSGDDSPPLPGDTVATFPVEGSGNEAAVGYNDPKSLQKSEAGEKRIYARDENGNEIAEIWIKRTGEITLVGPEASVTLTAGGEIVLNEGEDYAVKFNALEAEFNKLNDQYNKLIGVLNSWVPVPQDGGAALKTALSGAAPLDSTADITQTKVELVRI